MAGQEVFELLTEPLGFVAAATAHLAGLWTFEAKVLVNEAEGIEGVGGFGVRGHIDAPPFSRFLFAKIAEAHDLGWLKEGRERVPFQDLNKGDTIHNMLSFSNTSHTNFFSFFLSSPFVSVSL